MIKYNDNDNDNDNDKLRQRRMSTSEQKDERRTSNAFSTTRSTRSTKDWGGSNEKMKTRCS